MTDPLNAAREKFKGAGDCPDGRCRCPLLTLEEVSAWLAQRERTVETWRYRYPQIGPPTVKVGGSVRYRPCEVLAWRDAAA